MKAIVEMTGEVLEFDPTTPEQILETWRLVSDYIKAYDKIKNQLKDLVPDIIDYRGVFEHNGYLLRQTSVQRKTYDKTVMREVLDPDAFDVLLKPDKTAVDKYLKENLKELGDVSTQLRATMIDDGRPYTVIKMEKLDRKTEGGNVEKTAHG